MKRRHLVHSTLRDAATEKDDLRCIGKFEALVLLLDGNDEYPVFQTAANFGCISSDDLKKCTGSNLINTLQWVSDGGILNKDHALSRNSTYKKIMADEIGPLDDDVQKVLSQYSRKSMGKLRFHSSIVEVADEKSQLLFWHAQLLGHPANCHITDCSYNSRKGDYNSIEIPDLADRIMDWERGMQVYDIPEISFPPQPTRLPWQPMTLEWRPS